MINIKIKEVKKKAEKKAFMMLPFDIYKDNEYWVSPLLLDLRHMFGLNGFIDGLLGAKGEHPFYEYGQIQ